MSKHNQKVVSIWRGVLAWNEDHEVVDLAYGLWLAHGFRDCTPEEALFTALRRLNGSTAAELFLVPKLNSVRPKIYPLYRMAQQ